MFGLTSIELSIFVAFCIFVVVYILSLVKVRQVEELGVKFVKPLPLFGNLFRTLCGLDHFTVPIKNVYDSFPTDRYVVLFEFLKSTIILRDQELIKAVTVKDFDYFHDIPLQIDEEIDPVFGRILLALKGQKWRQMRSTLSPAFTSAKIKNMFNFMTECSSKVVNFYTVQSEGSPKMEIDMKDICSRYTIDVIASTAFSFEVDSLSQRKNQFYDKATVLAAQTVSLFLKFMGFRLFPKIMKFFGIRLMPEASVSFFRNLLHQTMSERESNGQYRPDMIHLLLEAKRGNLKHEEVIGNPENEEFANVQESHIGLKSETIKWGDDDYIAQCIVFILAGYTTTATVLSFLMYELAVNPDVQTKLQEEIDSVVEENDGRLTYNSLLKMEYMDMVVSECLRKWPAIPFINRLCRQQYDLGPVRAGSKHRMQVEKGETVWVPVYAIHMNPEFWPNPDRFDPERFSEDNRKDIRPLTYLPFGSGPRSCIGSRFALMEVKILVFSLLSKFSLEACSETPIPMILSTKTLFIESKHGFRLGMRARKQ